MKERIKRYLELKRISQKEFCDAIEVASSYLSTPNKDIPQKKLSRIKELYPDLNIDWLIEGKGQMINTDTPASPTISIPVLPLAAHGGSLIGYDVEGVVSPKCETIISPIAGAEMAIHVAGDSMAPYYPSGSKVLIKSIDHNIYIAWGEVYVLDTTNGTLLKEVQPSDKEGAVRCISLNPDERYKPFDVPLSEIRKMYKVLACITVR